MGTKLKQIDTCGTKLKSRQWHLAVPCHVEIPTWQYLATWHNATCHIKDLTCDIFKKKLKKKLKIKKIKKN